MENLYEILLGRPPSTKEAEPGPRVPFAWDDADGAGPDRLFNRYRRLRLDARGLAAPRCPAAPSAARA